MVARSPLRLPATMPPETLTVPRLEPRTSPMTVPPEIRNSASRAVASALPVIVPPCTSIRVSGPVLAATSPPTEPETSAIAARPLAVTDPVMLLPLIWTMAFGIADRLPVALTLPPTVPPLRVTVPSTPLAAAVTSWVMLTSVAVITPLFEETLPALPPARMTVPGPAAPPVALTVLAKLVPLAERTLPLNAEPPPVIVEPVTDMVARPVPPTLRSEAWVPLIVPVAPSP